MSAKIRWSLRMPAALQEPVEGFPGAAGVAGAGPADQGGAGEPADVGRLWVM